MSNPNNILLEMTQTEHTLQHSISGLHSTPSWFPSFLALREEERSKKSVTSISDLHSHLSSKAFYQQAPQKVKRQRQSKKTTQRDRHLRRHRGISMFSCAGLLLQLCSCTASRGSDLNLVEMLFAKHYIQTRTDVYYIPTH